MTEKNNPIDIIAQVSHSADHIRPAVYENLALEQHGGSSIQEAVKESCISRTPDEVLILIFKMAIDGHDSLVLGALLLVCRSWNEIVIYTPILWSRIVLCPNDNHCEFTKLTKYVDIAIQKSLDLPLDIYINFGRLPGKGVMLQQTDPEYFRARIVMQDNNLELALLSRTIGDSGAVMKRWRSFFFKHNDAMAYIQDFFDSFIHSTPFLRHLTLHVRSVLRMRRFASTFPVVPALRTVVLNAGGDLDDIVQPPQTLETLAIGLRKNISILKPFSNLRILAIDCNFGCGDPHEDEVCADCQRFCEDGEAIAFPRLESLTLRSQQGNELFIQLFQRIEAFSLKELRLLGAVAVCVGLRAASFYKVEDLHLLMEEHVSSSVVLDLGVLLQHVGTAVEDIMSSSSLQVHISNYSALNNLTVTPWHLEPAIQALQTLKAESKAPTALHAISTLVGDREGAHLVEEKHFINVVETWKPVEVFLYESHSVVS